MIIEENESVEVAVSGGYVKYNWSEKAFLSERIEACCGAENSIERGDGSVISWVLKQDV